MILQEMQSASGGDACASQEKDRSRDDEDEYQEVTDETAAEAAEHLAKVKNFQNRPKAAITVLDTPFYIGRAISSNTLALQPEAIID